MKLLVSINENDKKEIIVDMRRTDNDKETALEFDTFNDIFDLIEYYVVGDEVEDTTNEILKNMKNQ